MSRFRDLLFCKKKKLHQYFVKVGNPTITDDFIYSISDYNSHLELDRVAPLSDADTWEIQFALAHLASNANHERPIIGYAGTAANDGNSPVVRFNQSFGNRGQYVNWRYPQLLITSKDSSSKWDINLNAASQAYATSWKIAGGTSGATFRLHKFGFDGSKYYWKEVTNFNGNPYLQEVASTKKCKCENKFAFFWNGWNSFESYPRPAIMDLKKFKIIIDEQEWMRGVVDA